jgi:uncharacterized protein GlcG (DUF336 family)
LNSKRVAVTLGAALACGSAYIRSAPPPAAPTAELPAALALKAAKTALALCVAQGYAPTVTVTDRAGVMRVLLVADGAGQVSNIASRRKAYTSASLGITTAQLAKNISVWHTVPQSIDPKLITFGGGIPILRHGIVVGAIGVGGADRGTSDEPNEACAQAGVDSIKKRLR